MDALKIMTDGMLKEERPNINVGDVVKVHVKIREGERERIQIFEGTIIARKGSGVSETFTVRRVSYGVGVERVFPVYSPRVIKVEIVKTGKVRKSKLYYLRDKIGKGTRIKELLGPKANARIAASRAANKAADAAEQQINAEAKAQNGAN